LIRADTGYPASRFGEKLSAARSNKRAAVSFRRLKTA
jgi:hypothetical protein